MSVVNLFRSRVGQAESSALFLSVLAAVFWGSNFEATRIVLADLPPWTAAAGRFLIAAGAIDPARFIEGEAPLERVPELLDEMGRERQLKTVIIPEMLPPPAA